MRSEGGRNGRTGGLSPESGGARRGNRGPAAVAAMVGLVCAGLCLVIGVPATLVNWGLGEPLDPGVFRFLIVVLGVGGGALGAVSFMLSRIGPARPKGRLPLIALVLGGYNMVVVLAAWHAGRLPDWSAMSHLRQDGCIKDMGRLADALTMYAVDNDGGFPLAHSWTRSLEPYLPSYLWPDGLGCSKAVSRPRSYALNARIAGARRDDLAAAAAAVVLFESDAGANAAGGPELLPKRPRHMGGDNYVLADGSARWVPREKAKELQWTPVLQAPAERK